MEPAAPRASLAPVWRRAGAWIVDGAVLGGVAGAFLWVAGSIVRHGTGSRERGLDWLAETLLAWRRLWIPGAVLGLLIAVFYLSFFTALGGQTPGKRLFGITVIERGGDCPSPVRSAVRSCLAMLSGLAGFGGFWLVLLDRRRQALHDRIAGTFVVLRG